MLIYLFGPASSFYWPYQKEDIRFSLIQNIISIVEATTRAFFFIQKYMNCAKENSVSLWGRQEIKIVKYFKIIFSEIV